MNKYQGVRICAFPIISTYLPSWGENYQMVNEGEFYYGVLGVVFELFILH